MSVRKDKGVYSFPNPIPLEKKFRDFLETEVEEKYFLRKETFEYLKNHSEECKEKGLGFRFQPMARGDCEIAKTITTREGTRGYENFIQDEVKILIQEATKKGYAIAEKGDSIDISYINQNKRRARVDKERAHTITTSPQIGTLTEHGVRKLTPRECWRLMGFTDSDFDKARAVCSDTQLYKQAGNSIVVQVLEGILKKLVEMEGVGE